MLTTGTLREKRPQSQGATPQTSKQQPGEPKGMAQRHTTASQSESALKRCSLGLASFPGENLLSFPQGSSPHITIIRENAHLLHRVSDLTIYSQKHSTGLVTGQQSIRKMIQLQHLVLQLRLERASVSVNCWSEHIVGFSHEKHITLRQTDYLQASGSG